jgi:hypothetical protein
MSLTELDEVIEELLALFPLDLSPEGVDAGEKFEF